MSADPNAAVEVKDI